MNQFGSGTLAATGPDPFCVPSFKTIEQNPQLPEAALIAALPLSALAMIGAWLVWRRRHSATPAPTL